MVITNQHLEEDDDSTSKHQAAEFSAVEDDDENNNSTSLPNLAGPWHKMPMMGQPAEAGSIGEVIFKKLYGDVPRTERFRVLWLAVRDFSLPSCLSSFALFPILVTRNLTMTLCSLVTILRGFYSSLLGDIGYYVV